MIRYYDTLYDTMIRYYDTMIWYDTLRLWYYDTMTMVGNDDDI